MQPVMTRDDIEHFLAREFPQLNGEGNAFSVVEIGPGSAVMRLATEDRHMRPGGTISGPSLFALADVAAYVAILAHIGPVALAVTSNMSINFLRKPKPGLLDGTARILKLGRRLAVAEIAIGAPGDDEICAHAVCTYAIPPQA